MQLTYPLNEYASNWEGRDIFWSLWFYSVINLTSRGNLSGMKALQVCIYFSCFVYIQNTKCVGSHKLFCGHF